MASGGGGTPPTEVTSILARLASSLQLRYDSTVEPSQRLIRIRADVKRTEPQRGHIALLTDETKTLVRDFVTVINRYEGSVYGLPALSVDVHDAMMVPNGGLLVIQPFDPNRPAAVVHAAATAAAGSGSAASLDLRAEMQKKTKETAAAKEEVAPVPAPIPQSKPAPPPPPQPTAAAVASAATDDAGGAKPSAAPIRAPPQQQPQQQQQQQQQHTAASLAASASNMDQLPVRPPSLPPNYPSSSSRSDVFAAAAYVQIGLLALGALAVVGGAVWFFRRRK